MIENQEFIQGEGGVRLDAALFARYPTSSRAFCREACAGGAILVDGRPAIKGLKLRGGETIRVVELAEEIDNRVMPDPSVRARCVFEDETLLAYDKPQEAAPGSHYSTTGVYISGGNMAAPKIGPLLADILDYMGVEKKYTAAESAAVDVVTPQVTGMTVDAADSALRKKGLSSRTVGEGDTVTAQIPASGASVPGGSKVILYLGSAAPEETGTVPNVVGLGYESAKKRLEDSGFFMRAAGVSTYYGNSTTASGQSVAAGETAPIGTVIEVQFSNVVEDGL